MLYVHFPGAGLVALITAYAKNEQENIDASDRQLFRKMVAGIDAELRARKRD